MPESALVLEPLLTGKVPSRSPSTTSDSTRFNLLERDAVAATPVPRRSTSLAPRWPSRRTGGAGLGARTLLTTAARTADNRDTYD